MQEKRLAGKVAVVTGAGSGVGRAYAHALAAEGAKLIVNDYAVSSAEHVASEISATGGRAHANGDDVSNFAASGRIIDQARDAFGSIDILIANAGIIRPGNMHEVTGDDWAQVLAVHANGTFNCYRHAVPHMIRQNSGTIITTGAKPIDKYFPGLAAYRAAKAAILVLTLSAAKELASYNINVNSIMPGATATLMQQRYMQSLIERGINIDQHWPKTVPPETVPPLGIFLCTNEGRSISGYSFYLFGNAISVSTSYGSLASIESSGTVWERSALEEGIPDLLKQVDSTNRSEASRGSSLKK
jgi:NAD(P)-dependent dehydrogenase (short-subunit alcohol dehydrogenase family)